MLESKEIPSSFLENINMVNTATNFFNTNIILLKIFFSSQFLPPVL